MTVTLYTPESNRTFETEKILFPGAQSPFMVLPGHAPIISTLTAGSIRWESASGEESLAIRSGVVRVSGDKIEICAE